MRSTSCGSALPTVSCSPTSTCVAVLDQQAGALADRVGKLLGAVVGDDDDLAGLVGVLDADATGGLGDRRLALGLAGLEQLDHTRQTFGDVVADATPPVWKVRIVSCVPGSPIDWAAMMPTASPMSTSLPVASERP